MEDHERFISTLRAGSDALGMSLSEAQQELAWRHFERVIETNALFNLTRITEPEAAAAKLYADSLAPAAWIDDAEAKVGSCLDVGSGAGFPAVPLAIIQPAWQVAAIDSTGKKANFIEQCARDLPIPNLRARHERAGIGTPSGKHDLIVFKAVGTLAKCLGFAAGRVAPNGYVIVFKGRGLDRAELDEGQAAAEEIRMQTWDTVEYDIPLGDESLAHSLVVYKRVQ